jgi:hypothetical protein
MKAGCGSWTAELPRMKWRETFRPRRRFEGAAGMLDRSGGRSDGDVLRAGVADEVVGYVGVLENVWPTVEFPEIRRIATDCNTFSLSDHASCSTSSDLTSSLPFAAINIPYVPAS